MQYSIKVSAEPKFKSKVVKESLPEEQDEESKSRSHDSDASSLVTEEDTSGNPLPPEIVKIRQRNKQLQKELTNSIMNFKSSSRSAIHSSSNSGSPFPSNLRNNSNDIFSRSDCPEALSAIAGNEALKSLLEKIMKLQIDYENAKKTLHENEEEIFQSESEYVSLKMNLHSIEDELNLISTTRTKGSNCGCYLI